MKNKELAINKIEILEGALKHLRYLATEGKDIQEYNNSISKIETLLDEVKSLIERA